MRLSDVLSKHPCSEYKQIDGFLQNKKGMAGQKVDISVGSIAINFFCRNCDDLRTFYSKPNLSCIFVNKNVVSIDCVLTCGCGASVPAWFLVESDNDITGPAPEVRIMKKNARLSEHVANTSRYGEYSRLLDKAEQAYNEGLGAGAIVYLRKVFEKITVQTANAMQIEYNQHEGGNPKNFKDLLIKVDKQCSIIPVEFAANGYRLFQELSNVVHGEYDENLGLIKFDPLYRLVIGILDNVKNHEELLAAMVALGWDDVNDNTNNG